MVVAFFCPAYLPGLQYNNVKKEPDVIKKIQENLMNNEHLPENIVALLNYNVDDRPTVSETTIIDPNTLS